MAMARWLLPVPVPPTNTTLRCWVINPPPARSLTSVWLIGVPSKWKSLRSLASGSLAMVSWYLIERACFSLTSALSRSTTIRWMDRWQTTGSVAAKPGIGHCRSPLEQHEQWLLDLVTAEPDLTLDEIGTRLASAKKLKVGRTSIWRFYEQHRITFKKTLHAAEQDRPDVAAARAALKT